MVVTTGIHHDSGEPGGEFGLALEAVDFLNQRATDLLRDVLRVRVRFSQAPGDPMNAVIMTLQ